MQSWLWLLISNVGINRSVVNSAPRPKLDTGRVGVVPADLKRRTRCRMRRRIRREIYTSLPKSKRMRVCSYAGRAIVSTRASPNFARSDLFQGVCRSLRGTFSPAKYSVHFSPFRQLTTPYCSPSPSPPRHKPPHPFRGISSTSVPCPPPPSARRRSPTRQCPQDRSASPRNRARPG
jgi:hypothetical protein